MFTDLHNSYRCSWTLPGEGGNNLNFLMVKSLGHKSMPISILYSLNQSIRALPQLHRTRPRHAPTASELRSLQKSVQDTYMDFELEACKP